MQSITDNTGTKRAVEEIIFERNRTVVSCVDGEMYEMATVTVMGLPLSHETHIEMYPSPTSIEHKAFCN